MNQAKWLCGKAHDSHSGGPGFKSRGRPTWLRFSVVSSILKIAICHYYVCVPMPIYCTITCFGFHARWIDGVKCGLFSNHAPLGQTTLRVG